MEDKIDFVVTWVDNTDFQWQKSKEEYYPVNKKDESNSTIRYRDWGTLKYWFRAIEKNAGWVNKIYFVTCGQIPSWLNIDNEKLVLVNHEEYIPKEYLPTFNSNVIEIFFNRIPKLSEKFVYFNDDVFVLNKIDKTYFFENNLPKDALVFNAVSVNSKNSIIEHTVLNNLEILSKYFDKKDVINNNKRKVYNLKYGKDLIKSVLLSPWKYFTGIENYHTAMPYLKSTWDMLWSKEENTLQMIGKNKFRTKYDINHWIFKYWQLFEGKFIPTSNKKNVYYDLKNDNKEFFNKIENGKINIACINDSNPELDFENVKKELIEEFKNRFPQKSSFEK